ncbi:hypothetical protein DF286_11570 [Sphingosinicella humi]|uniref:TIGR03016 family PEP-CTERM system-associated outer membrane protein n=1 Tax=Allosphingosinicella humi TaxID=2068657 RepID=A0A2U2J516_9SPHN|nr:hypothetical protein DF286_11570 [Sphingosinicella humi]
MWMGVLVARYGILTCGLLGIAGSHGAAFAQTVPLNYSVNLDLLYDSNIARVSEEAAAARGIEREDLRITPALSITLNLPRGRHTASANANLGYDFYLRNPRLDRERLSATAGLNSDWGRCDTSVNAGFERRQTEFEDIVAGPLDNTMTKWSASAGLSCPRPAGFYPGVRASIESARNDREARQDADYDYDRVEGFLAYARPSLGEAVVFASRGSINFPEREIDVGGLPVQDEVQTTEVGGRFSRELGSLVRGSVQVSYTWVDRSNPIIEDFNGLTLAATLRIRPEGRLRGTLFAERAVRPTSRVGVSYSVAETYRADLQYDLTSSTVLTSGTSLRRREFVFAGPNFAGSPSTEDIVSAFASVRTNIRSRIFLGVEVLWERRDADLSLFDYTSVRFGITSKWLFG